MKDQTIKISLNEYKKIRDTLNKLVKENEYYKGQYQLLSFAYNQLLEPEEEIKVKEKIGF